MKFPNSLIKVFPASQSESIAYISDVGADMLKPLFVVGCCITVGTPQGPGGYN